MAYLFFVAPPPKMQPFHPSRNRTMDKAKMVHSHNKVVGIKRNKRLMSWQQYGSISQL